MATAHFAYLPAGHLSFLTVRLSVCLSLTRQRMDTCKEIGLQSMRSLGVAGTKVDGSDSDLLRHVSTKLE